MRSEKGIAIIDIYGQADLDACYDSIPEGTENVIVVSDTKNKLPDCVRKQYGNGVPYATLKNWAINHFRIQGLKHFFLINSNQIIKDANVFNNIIKTAQVFGTWAILGPSNDKITTIEDDENNISLHLSPTVTSDFIYIYDGVVSNVGFFDERLFNGKNLDVLDYVLRMREKTIYPPTGFNPVYQNGIDTTNGKITKPDYCEIENADSKLHMAYAYFLHRHQYIPGQNDPKPVSNDILMKNLEELQKNYSKK